MRRMRQMQRTGQKTEDKTNREEERREGGSDAGLATVHDDCDELEPIHVVDAIGTVWKLGVGKAASEGCDACAAGPGRLSLSRMQRVVRSCKVSSACIEKATTLIQSDCSVLKGKREMSSGQIGICKITRQASS